MEQLTRFFLEPKQILHKRYEALRALCVEKLSAKEVATRFGYSIFTVNAMKRDFAKAIKNGQTPLFFLTPTPGRKPKENRDELKQQIITLPSSILRPLLDPLAIKSHMISYTGC